jgi:mRNA-degrading endonuclease HigB of HigAB toxin-antitoxin module
MLIYYHSFAVQRYSATCFDLQEVIIRNTYKNPLLVLKLYFDIDLYYYNSFIFDITDTEYYLIVKYIS